MGREVVVETLEEMCDLMCNNRIPNRAKIARKEKDYTQAPAKYLDTQEGEEGEAE